MERKQDQSQFLSKYLPNLTLPLQLAIILNRKHSLLIFFTEYIK
ncbi:hypothetical protein [Chryseobacterium sp. NFX27]